MYMYMFYFTYFSFYVRGQLIEILNQELKSVFEWWCANRLSVNVTKTKFMIFRQPRNCSTNKNSTEAKWNYNLRIS